MSTLLWSVVAVVGLLAGHTAVNARCWLRRPPDRPATVEVPVTVLLPLRDEAHRVAGCLRALLAQRGVARLSIVVLDDCSTDDTAEVVAAVTAGDPRVRLVRGAPPPPGWLGKPHACHQLAEQADAGPTGTAHTGAGHAGAEHAGAGSGRRGPADAAPDTAVDAGPDTAVLVFVDADVTLAPHAVAAAVALLHEAHADLLSPYPRIIVGGVGERLVQPLLQWSWLTFLPLRAVERSPRPSLAAAGGQLLVVSREGYRRAGGHAAVRDRVLEDVELARAVKRAGGRVVLADGSRIAECRMYGSWPQVRDGYTKSLWASAGSPLGAAAVVLMLVLLYVAPLGAALTGSVPGLAGYALAVAGRVVAARATGGRAWPDALAHPVSIVLLCYLTGRSHLFKLRGRLVWKGRSLSGP